MDDLASRLEALGRQQRGAAPAAPRTRDALDGCSAGDARPHAVRAAPRAALDGRPGDRETGHSWTIDGGAATAGPSTAGPSTAGRRHRPIHGGAGAAAPPVTAGARPSTNALQPQDIYQAAYIDFSKGSYALAMAGFREFIRRFPDHPLAGNAQYWIGESHFSIARGYANSGQNDKVTPEMELAVQEFRKVIANYPRGEKAPTALYKEALALLELKQPAVAQQRLEYLVSNFPQSEETPLARERLAALKTR